MMEAIREVKEVVEEEIDMGTLVLLHFEETIHFAHQLEKTESEKCKRLHGHTAKVEIEIYGVLDEETGMLVDFTKLKKMLEKFDHTFLNQVISPPTVENLAIAINREIWKLPEASRFSSVRVRVYESKGRWVEVRSLSEDWMEV